MIPIPVKVTCLRCFDNTSYNNRDGYYPFFNVWLSTIMSLKCLEKEIIMTGAGIFLVNRDQ